LGTGDEGYDDEQQLGEDAFVHIKL